ncbi:MAG TPA: BatA and WFA domain-containing protein [Vicinamibacterales bacterium]
MSFGAMAGWQAALLIAAAAGAAAWLFLLRIRPPRVNVPSLLFWRRVLDQKRDETWWERFRRAVSLAATILIALALAMAVARPGPRAASATRGRMLIVIDSSWSMLAETSSGDTRWDRAIREARALAASAGGDDIALATTGDGLVEGPTSDQALIETAIERLAPSGGVNAPWPRVGGADVVHFLTDGAHLRALDRSVVVHSVYERAANVAITAFDARPIPARGAAAAEAYLEIANYSPKPQQVRVTISRGAAIVFDQPVSLAAGELVRQVAPLAAGGGPRLLAKVSAAADALPIDDEAVAWIQGAEPLTVVVVSEKGSAVAQLLKRDPSVRVIEMAATTYQPGKEDVVVFDRWVPETPPTRPALVVAPPRAPWIGRAGSDEKNPRWSVSAAHPVLDGVDPLTVDIKYASGHGYGSGSDQAGTFVIARSEKGTPLVSIVDLPDRRAIVLGFSVADSNLAFAPAFPVIVGNALEWLARPTFEASTQSGPLTLPGSVTRVVAQDGTVVPLLRAGDQNVVTLQQPGLYRVEAGGARGVIAVNVGDPEISNLSRTSLSGGEQAVKALGLASGRPWWMYGVFLAFVLIAVEWWTWQRRITV